VKRTHLFILAALAPAASLQAQACALTNVLVARYGISFSGFDKPIPESAEPKAARDGAWVRAVVRDKVPVSDGFHHTVLMDVAKKQAWILRTGGFAPVYQWYGPVDVSDVGDAAAAGCGDAPGVPANLKIEPSWDAANKKGAGGSLDARTAGGNQAVGGT
jgi:hypothetical protein